MNWGYKIMFVYLLFVIGMLTMVYKCTQQNTELVADNYYDQEVKYQERYNQIKNSSTALVNCVVVSEHMMQINFPGQFSKSKIKGSLNFYRPDNKSKDFTLAIGAIDGKMQINSDKLTKGYWRLTIAYSCDGKDYLQEEKLMVP